MTFGDGKFIDHATVHAQSYVPPIVVQEPKEPVFEPAPIENRPTGVTFRRASMVTNVEFPYADPTVTFIGLLGHREFLNQAHTIRAKRDMIEDVASDDVILAVWPGRTRSDVFWVDDYSTALAALLRGQRGV